MQENKLELDWVNGATRVTRLVNRAPMRLLETGLHDDGVEVQLASYGGGVLQGDQVELRIRCGDDTGLRLKSQANTHVYRNESGREAVQLIRADCGERSRIRVLPEPLVPHQGAVFRQEQHWDLAPSTDFILADWMQSGRSESCEQFAFEKIQSRLLIRVGKQLVLEENLCFQPGREQMRSPAAFGPFDMMLNLYIIGPDAECQAQKLTPFLDFPEQHTRALPNQRSGPLHGPLCALNPLPGGNGYLLRALANTRRQLQPIVDVFMVG
jgi:urease accessory protein